MTAKLAIVTGGSKGIGRACAIALDSAGYRVIAVGRDEAALSDLASTAGVGIAECDVSRESAVEELFEAAGPVDVVVLAAGVSSAASLSRVAVSDFRAAYEVNVLGALHCTKAALSGMRQRGWGRIVHVASTSSLVGYRYTAAYTASKHGVLGLMKVTAAELSGSGVTANAICPSYVRSDMTDRTIERITAATGKSRDEALAELVGSTPLGRLLEPEEIAAAAVYICSDAAAALNGHALVLDGGGLQY